MEKIKPKTKKWIVYKMLEQNKGQFVSVRDLMKESNSICVGSVCASLRKKGCIIVNKEVPTTNSLGMRVNHSSYQLVSGVLSDDDL